MLKVRWPNIMIVSRKKISGDSFIKSLRSCAIAVFERKNGKKLMPGSFLIPETEKRPKIF